ncbi:hypothetical protein [Pseudarthrobacter sp. S9]|uniref:hypothetical protein n=1 Tax=Pseudarthrobacter sp. S9 TaxID=3418421 RepID=UPI003D02FA22
MPPIRRDISIVIPAGSDDEILGDQVRAALRDRADDLESVELLAMTAYRDLPEKARTRLQIMEDQANALIRITLRPLAKTLTAGEANRIRDDIYRALHQGPVMELVAH